MRPRGLVWSLPFWELALLVSICSASLSLSFAVSCCFPRVASDGGS